MTTDKLDLCDRLAIRSHNIRASFGRFVTYVRDDTGLQSIMLGVYAFCVALLAIFPAIQPMPSIVLGVYNVVAVLCIVAVTPLALRVYKRRKNMKFQALREEFATLESIEKDRAAGLVSHIIYTRNGFIASYSPVEHYDDRPSLPAGSDPFGQDTRA
jgi:hypothetical protein